MNSLQRKILDPFVVEALSSLTTLAGLRAGAGAPFEDHLETFRFKGYAVATQVSGAVPGTILLHLYPETASDIGRRVFQGLTGDVAALASRDHVIDALTEWANILIGNATRALEISELDIRFTPPTFVHDTTVMHAYLEDVVEIVSVPIRTLEAGRLYFNYLLHEKTAA